MKGCPPIMAISLAIMLLVPLKCLSQEKNLPFGVTGYVSNMQSSIFEKPGGDWMNDNLLHNRLNFRIYPASWMTFGMEMRNRIFTGDMVKQGPGYADNIGSDPGFIDMSWNVVNESSVLMNVTLDRLWLDLSFNRVQLTMGRQRINWGQAFVWNPNDIFNVYSYFDFDYVERPGSDAIRLQIFPSYSSTIELAAKYDSEERVTVAALTRFNIQGFDLQLLGGYVNSEDLMLGTGWSGAIGSTSFRGEMSWFQKSANFADSSGTGLFTIGLDRAFSNNAMIQFQAMYCNRPLDFNNFESFYEGNLSAKELAFSEWSLFGSIAYPITPLFNLSLSAIFYPGLDGYFTGPSADISLATNIDLSLIWQHFNARIAGDRLTMNLAFIRIKYSF